MSETASLDAILDAPVNAPKVVPVAREELPSVEPSTEPEALELDTGESAATPAANDELAQDGPAVPRKALIEERRKRQELEQEIARLSQQLSAPNASQQEQQPQQQPRRQRPERPDPWVDPDGAMEHDRQLFEEALFDQRVATSRELMLATKPDFAEVEAFFVAAAKNNPQLQDAIYRHPLPAKFVYEQGKRMKALQEIGDDPATYRARIEEELRAKWLAEHGQSQPQIQTPKAPSPKSLAATPSAQPRDTRGRFAGPASLDDIIGG